MSLEEYTKISINTFMGLYQRGLPDDCPPDHSPFCQNMKFNRKGETSTRYGTTQSFSIGTAVNRMHVATFYNDTNILLTCDGAGNIHRSDTGGVLLSLGGMVDFRAANIYDFCLISPIVPGGNNSVYIWKAQPGGGGTDTIPIRLAAGQPPTSTFTAAETGTGHCDIGIHQFACSFITNSAYTTQPGPVISGVFTAVTVTSTGGKSIILTGIPTGPAGTVSRQILVTQADQDLFFYCPGGFINDNTTTSITVDFYDTDLAVSGDALFDLLPKIPAGNLGEAGGIVWYEVDGRTFYFGGEADLVRVTNPGDCESIDNVAGFIQLPTQFDGNIVRGACSLNGILYFMKGFGVISTIDNGGDPSSWPLNFIDSGVGATQCGMGTINLSQTGESQNNILLLGDFGGIYLFNGNVIQPPITWKINDIWSSIVTNTNIQVDLTISIDPYNKLIYVLSLGLNYILVADYNDGLDSQNIKWSKYIFPFTPTSIGMAYIQDLSDFNYWIRIGTASSGIFKIQPTLVNDSGTAIHGIYASYYLAYELGALNIFRFMRMRALGTGNLLPTVVSEDGTIAQVLPTLTLAATPGRDLLREFNFMNEKCSVQLSTNAVGSNFTLQRLDVYGKVRFPMRPQV